MRSFILATVVICMTMHSAGFCQSTQDYGSEDEKASTGLLDPSRLSIQHSASFGASTSNFSSFKSQSLYSTMFQYQFSKPVTLNFSFGLPIHSTYNPRFNLTPENLKSADYFSSIPFDASLTWQPRQNMIMQIGISRYTAASSYMTNPSLLYRPMGMWNGW